jgi:acyl-CoA dehydrogenase
VRLTRALVTDIALDGMRATGVTCTVAGKSARFAAGKDVILCGGAINSPQLLVLSGIGDPQQLAQHGIAPRAALPGVGRNLQDHISYLARYSRRDESPFQKNMRLDKLARSAMTAFLFGKGFASDVPIGVTAFIKSQADAAIPDIQILFLAAPFPTKPHLAPLIRPMPDGFGCRVALLRPQSRGQVTLRSSNPWDHPRIYLPQLAAGTLISAFCLTEPDAGTDAGSLRTAARRDNDGLILNGTKRFITNAPEAGLFTVFARTDANSRDARGVSAFLVERDTAGLSFGKRDHKMGQKGTHTCDVIFDNVRVSELVIVGGPAQEGSGFKTAMKVLDRGRLHISAVCVAVAERLIADSLSYAIEHHQFGQPLAEFQLIQAMLATMRTESYAARCMVEETARRKDAGGNVSTEAACCKLFASEMVGRVADHAVQIHVNAGYMVEFGIERFYRDVRLFRIYEGTSQIQQILIAKNMVRDTKA